MNRRKKSFEKVFIKKRIKEIVYYIVDNRGKNPQSFCGTGIPVIDNFQITGRKTIDLKKSKRFIDKNTYENFIRKHLKKDDVLITLVGNGYGNVGLAPNDKCVIIQNTIGLRCSKDCLNTYLFYLLSFNKSKVTDLNRGVAQPSVKVGDLMNLELNLPSLNLQTEITTLLSTYDDLIETNEKRIKILEEMAQRLYAEWFVKFKFPGHEKVKMVESGAEFGRIPEGWKIKKLEEVADVIFGFNFKSNKFNEKQDGVRVVRIRDILDGTTNTFSPENVEEKYKILKGDLLIGMDGIFHMKMWFTDNCYINQRVSRIRSNLPTFYISESIKYQLDILQKTIVGATVGHLSNGDIRSFNILLPDSESIFQSFHNITKVVINLKLNNRNLVRFRDLLIPQLVTGKRELR